jgi:hypothetical protein
MMSMTKEELAQKYARLFKVSKTKEDGANVIVEKLNSLRYEEDDELLTYEEKVEILHIIGEFLSRKRLFKYQNGGKILIVEEQDNEKFLSVLSDILSQLNK